MRQKREAERPLHTPDCDKGYSQLPFTVSQIYQATNNAYYGLNSCLDPHKKYSKRQLQIINNDPNMQFKKCDMYDCAKCKSNKSRLDQISQSTSPETPSPNEKKIIKFKYLKQNNILFCNNFLFNLN